MKQERAVLCGSFFIMTEIYKTKGIILKQQPFGEQDRIIFAATPSYGKIKIISKNGFRRSAGAFGLFDAFAELEFILERGRNFDRCSEVSLSKSYSAISSDYFSSVAASYFCEAVCWSVPFFGGNDRSYFLLCRLFDALERGEGIALIPSGLYFIMKNSGHAPFTSACCECGSDEGLEFFSPSEGLVCGKCVSESCVYIGPEASLLIKAIPFVKTGELAEAFNKDVFIVAENALRKSFEFVFDRPILSSEFLKSADAV